jgi:hypothetical protein
MEYDPPIGSQIEIRGGLDETQFVWKQGRKGVVHYLVLAFLLFWFCGWTVGGCMAVFVFFVVLIGWIAGEAPVFAPLFLFFWLGAWTVGEIVTFKILYFTLRPQKPSVLTLSSKGIAFETGTRSPNLTPTRPQKKFYSSFEEFRNRKFSLALPQIRTVNLGWAGEKQRLSFDYGVERIEIGQSLSEPEREWLYSLLLEHASQVREV